MGDQLSESVHKPEASASTILRWYDRHRRELPWRAAPGAVSDPYRVWLSEIMLQQTTVAVVKGYFERFTARWPTVFALAEAEVGEVMREWAGLGYYSRARNLHSAARTVAATKSGFPDSEAELRDLPGIGPYTAAAIAAIAFREPAVVIDGNVERVITRLHAIEQPIKKARRAIREFAAARTPAMRPGDYAQAMMDLGATICTPRRPTCVVCPLSEECLARQRGLQDVLPLAAMKTEKPVRRGSVFVVRRTGEYLVRTRPNNGLLGGMTEFPGSAWDQAGDPAADARPLEAEFVRCSEQVMHGFTHFSLQLDVFVADLLVCPTPSGCRWVSEGELVAEALPTLMRKVAAVAEKTLDGREAPAAAAPRKRKVGGRTLAAG